MSIGSEITQLLLNQGNIAANRVERQGQIAGQTIAGVGQAVGGAIQQATDPKMQEYRRSVEGRKALADAIKTTPPSESGPNYEGIATKLSASGYPDIAESWLSTASKNKENLSKLDQMKREAAKATQELQAHMMATIGDAAFHAQSPSDFTSSVGLLAAHGQIDEKTANGILSQADQAGPDGWARARNTYLKFSPAWAKQEEERSKAYVLPQGATLATGAGETLATGQPKPKTEAELAMDAAKGDTDAAAAMNLLKPPPQPESSQAKDVLLDGKPSIVTWEPKSKKWVDGNGQNITNAATRIRPIPPAAIQTQGAASAALANLPTWALDDSRPAGAGANTLDPIVRMTPNGLYQAAQTYIATGQFPPVARGNDPTSQAVRAAVTSKVGAISAASGMDEPTLRAFYKSNAASLGQQQKMYDAVQAFMNTADRNVDLLEGTLKKLPDIGSPLFNKPMRDFAKNVGGDENMAKFATYLQSVQNEYARIIAQPNLSGQLTDSARHEAEQLISPKATVPQILASIQALKAEGTNRLVSLGEQIQRTQSRMQSGGDRVKVKGPNGETGTVPKGTALPSGWSLQ